MSQTDWITLATAACTAAGIKPEPIEIITTWEQTFSHVDLFRNNAVFRVGEAGHILKLYGTDAQRHASIERTALTSIAGAIPAPRVIAHGTVDDGRPYLIMSAVPGRTLQDAWPELTCDELHAVIAEIGRMTAAYHRAPVDALAAVEAQHGRREALIAHEQAKRLTEIKALSDLTPQHRDELIAFTQEQASTVSTYPALLTHSDLSWAHIYVDAGREGPVVSGFIDWAEAMLGPAEWDLSFHWYWTVSGDRALMKTCLDAYFDGQPPPDDFQRRCFIAHFFTYSMSELWPTVRLSPAPDESYVDALMNTLCPPDVFIRT